MEPQEMAFSIRDELQTRRARLQQALPSSDRQIEQLIGEVDAALGRLNDGSYGLCEVCREPIEAERLAVDPLTRFCIDHLTPQQQRDLEADLELASEIQRGLLPKEGTLAGAWETAYHYEGLGPVSGDYCDLLVHESAAYFAIGDVSGKGVAAAMLMTHLHATLRVLIPQGLPLEEIAARASRMFCESSLPTHFATLVCGKAEAAGDVELCIAGHLPAYIVRGSEVEKVSATGLPLGLFCDERFGVSKTRLNPGDGIVLYTDGLSESLDPSGREYGIDRLGELLKGKGFLSPKEIVARCLADLESFRAGETRRDDLTIMVLKRA